MKCSEIRVGEVYAESYGRAVVVLAKGLPRGPGLGRRKVTNDGVRVRTVYEADSYRGFSGDLTEEQQAKTERVLASRDLAPLQEGGIQKWRDQAATAAAVEERRAALRSALEALGFNLRSQDTYGIPGMYPTPENLAVARELLDMKAGRLERHS